MMLKGDWAVFCEGTDLHRAAGEVNVTIKL